MKSWIHYDLKFCNSEAAHKVKDRANQNIISALLKKIQDLEKKLDFQEKKV